MIHSFRRPLGKAVPGRRWSGFRSAAGAVRCQRAVRDPGWTCGLRCSGDRRACLQNFCRSCRRVRRNRLPHRGSRRRWGSDRGSRYRCLYKCIRAGSRLFRRTRDGGRGRLRRLFSGGAECPRVLCSSINIHRQGRGRSLRKTLQIRNQSPALRHGSADLAAAGDIILKLLFYVKSPFLMCGWYALWVWCKKL